MTGLDICQESEGYALALPDDSCTSYWDAMGCVWTCGFGTTGSDVNRHTHWSRVYAVQRLHASWLIAEAGVRRASPVLSLPENSNRLEAITDFAYNLGVGRYQSSTLRRQVDRKNWDAASREFPKWNLAGGKVRAGLVTRRAKERLLFDTPVEADQPEQFLPTSSSTVSTDSSAGHEPSPYMTPVEFFRILRDTIFRHR